MMDRHPDRAESNVDHDGGGGGDAGSSVRSVDITMDEVDKLVELKLQANFQLDAKSHELEQARKMAEALNNSLLNLESEAAALEAAKDKERTRLTAAQSTEAILAKKLEVYLAMRDPSEKFLQSQDSGLQTAERLVELGEEQVQRLRNELEAGNNRFRQSQAGLEAKLEELSDKAAQEELDRAAQSSAVKNRLLELCESVAQVDSCAQGLESDLKAMEQREQEIMTEMDAAVRDAGDVSIEVHSLSATVENHLQATRSTLAAAEAAEAQIADLEIQLASTEADTLTKATETDQLVREFRSKSDLLRSLSEEVEVLLRHQGLLPGSVQSIRQEVDRRLDSAKESLRGKLGVDHDRLGPRSSNLSSDLERLRGQNAAQEQKLDEAKQKLDALKDHRTAALRSPDLCLLDGNGGDYSAEIRRVIVLSSCQSTGDQLNSSKDGAAKDEEVLLQILGDLQSKEMAKNRELDQQAKESTARVEEAERQVNRLKESMLSIEEEMQRSGWTGGIMEARESRLEELRAKKIHLIMEEVKKRAERSARSNELSLQLRSKWRSLNERSDKLKGLILQEEKKLSSTLADMAKVDAELESKGRNDGVEKRKVRFTGVAPSPLAASESKAQQETSADGSEARAETQDNDKEVIKRSNSKGRPILKQPFRRTYHRRLK